MRERREDGQVSINETLIEESEESNQISLQHAVLKLPAELVSRIFSQLDCVDLIHCSLVCRQWYLNSSELREGWKNEYIEACGIFGPRIKKETHPPSTTCSIRGYSSYVYV
ncbi:hypothetical protein Syun_020903 [Stephania yunnanensis]|uniref:F-box domain-containing protein n=1 Tax=Stephania yunnanensis TaxID=152371 RepID=A0AAP0IG08_9MAGN